MKIIFFFVALLACAACDTIGNWMDNLGEHMPVVGERCEHWQCLTEEGRQRSDEIKQEKMRPAPPPGAPPDKAAAAPPAPSTPGR